MESLIAWWKKNPPNEKDRKKNLYFVFFLLSPAGCKNWCISEGIFHRFSFIT
jgi:hypothetical protein